MPHPRRASRQMYIPVEKDFRLNERMYGALAGLNKVETVEKHGKDQVMIWRRSYDIPPPEAGPDHEYHPSKSPWAASIPKDQLPSTEVRLFKGGDAVLLCVRGCSFCCLASFRPHPSLPHRASS